MKYRFIAEHRNAHSVEMMARVLRVARSGFYAWLNRQPSSRTETEKHLVQQVREIQAQVKHRYGSPRLTRSLAIVAGTLVTIGWPV